MSMRQHPLVRLLVTIPLCGVLVAGLLGAAWLAMGRPTLARATFLDVERVSDTSYEGGLPDQPFFFLALGNDSRQANEKGLGDAIHVIGINPATQQGTMLNVPRDTEAPGGGKINAFHPSGGLPAMIDQLNRMMGIQINYAITTDFPRFIRMVNGIGGLTINLPYALHDREFSGADFPAGVQTINGDQALSIARDRHSFPSQGDRQRTWDQGFLILSALGQLREGSNLTSTMGLIAGLARGVTTENVGIDELYNLGRLALAINPANVKNCTIPTGGGAGSNLAVTAGAQQLFADFRDDGVVGSCEEVPGGKETPR
jgi:LCP family protein required for cell wall assembly